MACTRGPYGRCTRCGIKHPSKGVSPSGDSEVTPRAKAIKEALRRKAAREAKLSDYSAKA